MYRTVWHSTDQTIEVDDETGDQRVINDAELRKRAAAALTTNATFLELSAKVDQLATIPSGYTTADLQSAIDAADGVLHLPPGDYALTGTGAELLLVSKPLKIKGSGNATRLIVGAGVPGTTDVLRISPAVGMTGKTLYSIEDLQIVAESGTPARHGIHVDVTTPGRYLSNFTLRNVVVRQLGGKAFKLTNPANTDGFFTSEIAHNLLYGGMDLERLGDSVNIYHNTITGNGIGIDVSAVSGAAMTIIENNNITSSGGAIRIKSGAQVKILRNQIEQTVAYTGTDDACIVIGTVETVGSAEIDGNNINAQTTNIAHAIKLDRCSHSVVDRNRLTKGTAECIYVTANSNRVFVGRMNFYIASGSEVKPSIRDEGDGTFGVERPAALGNGWVDYDTANYGSATFHKDVGGVVRLAGVIKGGTTTAGTVIFTLPVNFRPQKVRYFIVYSEYAGAPVDGLVQILPTGEVRIQKGGASVLNMNDVSFLS